MPFFLGDRVTVEFKPDCPGAPSWPLRTKRFEAVVVNPSWSNKWVYVQPADEYLLEFGAGWYCHKDWVKPMGGPW